MIPKKGQHIKCVLRNNLIIDGIVDSWSDDKSVLLSRDGASASVIQHTLQDVVVIKIIFKNLLQTKESLEQKFNETLSNPSDDLRLKNLAELKTLMIEQEKKIISEKLKDHQIGNVRKVEYEQPRFFKMPSIKSNSK